MKRVGACLVVLILEWNIVVGGMDCGLHVFCEVEKVDVYREE